MTLFELLVVLVVLVALGGLLLVNLTQDNLVIDLDGPGGQDGRSPFEIVTDTTLARVAEAIVGPGGYVEVMRYARDTSNRVIGYGTGLPWPTPKLVANVREDHPQLNYLFVVPEDMGIYDPLTQIGWRGPWLDVSSAAGYAVEGTFTSRYGLGDGPGGDADDIAPLDAWGRPIVIQWYDPDDNGPDPDGDGEIDNPLELDRVRLISAGPNRVLDTQFTDFEAQGDDLALYLFRQE